MKIVVRSSDLTVFEVDPASLEPKRCSTYDPYCFSSPESGVHYIEYAEWVQYKSTPREYFQLLTDEATA